MAYSFKSIIVYIDVLHHFPSTRNHSYNPSCFPFFDLLIEKENHRIQTGFLQFSFEFFCLFLIKLFLALPQEKPHLPSPKYDLTYDLDRRHLWIHFFTCTNKLNGLLTIDFVDRLLHSRVSPSNFVRMTPPKLRTSLKAFAVFTASWPVMESTTKSFMYRLLCISKSPSSLFHLQLYDLRHQ